MRSTILIAGLLAAGSAHAADPAARQPPSDMAFEPAWVTTFNTEARYVEFNGTKGQPTGIAPVGVRGKGSQLYLPFAVSIAGNPSPDLKLELAARGGYVDSRQTTFGFSGAVQHAIDSQISATATYLGIDGVLARIRKPHRGRSRGGRHRDAAVEAPEMRAAVAVVG